MYIFSNFTKHGLSEHDITRGKLRTISFDVSRVTIKEYTHTLPRNFGEMQISVYFEKIF